MRKGAGRRLNPMVMPVERKSMRPFLQEYPLLREEKGRRPDECCLMGAGPAGHKVHREGTKTRGKAFGIFRYRGISIFVEVSPCRWP